MSLFTPEDLATLAGDLGQVDFACGDVTVKGFLDITDEEGLSGDGAPLRVRRLRGRVPTGVLPDLGVGVAIVVAGNNYTVSQLYRIQDGAWTEMLLDTAAA